MKIKCKTPRTLFLRYEKEKLPYTRTKWGELSFAQQLHWTHLFTHNPVYTSKNEVFLNLQEQMAAIKSWNPVARKNIKWKTINERVV